MYKGVEIVVSLLTLLFRHDWFISRYLEITFIGDHKMGLQYFLYGYERA